MFRFVFALLAVGVLCSQSIAQPAPDLLRRIEKLEQDNRSLQRKVSMLGFAMQATAGTKRPVTIGNKTVATLIVSPNGWGQGRPQDVAAVCASVVDMLMRAIPPEAGREPTIILVNDSQGPMTLTQRGPRGEYIVLLNTGDRRWSQLAYQFSHELGHVLCGDLSLQKPQHWFEEAFCESVSLWTMDKLGISWKTNAPYDSWRSYAPNLSSYIDDVRNRIPKQDNIAKWYPPNSIKLTKDAYDRDKNLVLARAMAIEAHKNSDFLKAFYYMRRDTLQNRVNSMQWLLDNWHASTPDEMQFAPARVAEIMGMKITQKQ